MRTLPFLDLWSQMEATCMGASVALQARGVKRSDNAMKCGVVAHQILDTVKNSPRWPLILISPRSLAFLDALRPPAKAGGRADEVGTAL